MSAFNNIRALIIDMDGVLWEGHRPLPGLHDFFALLRTQQLPFVLATNNASLTQQQYIDKLDIMGVTVNASEILTSSMATAEYLSEQYIADKTDVYVIGEEGLRAPLRQKGFNLLEQPYTQANAIADLVVCGLDRNLDWSKMAEATLHINAGAKLIATNADTTLPTERGPVLGNGAIIAALQTATNSTATVIGKPEAIMYQQAIKILATAPEYTIAIGDRLNTDILGAVNTGIRSLMVLTGISTEADITALDYSPNWVFADLPAVTDALTNSLDCSKLN